MSFHFGIDPRKYNDRNPSTIRLISTNTTQMNQTRLIPSIRIPDFAEPINSEELYDTFDLIVDMTSCNPVNYSIEHAITKLYEADNSILWLNNPSDKYLFVPSTGRVCSYDKGILGVSFSKQKAIFCDCPSREKAFDQAVDSDQTPTLYIPLAAKDGNRVGIIQVFRKGKSFSDNDISVAEQFIQKFQIYYHILFPPKFIETFDETSPISALIAKLESQLHARSIEIWQKHSDYIPSRFDPITSSFQPTQPGVVSECFKLNAPIIYTDVTAAPGFNPIVDGTQHESVCMHPVESLKASYSIVARGKEFGFREQMIIEAFAPLFTKLVDNPTVTTARRSTTEIFVEIDDDYADRLKALLDVAEILSGVLDIDTLVTTIMDRACELLNTERCSLFLVDTVKQELVTRFHGGLEQSIRVPLSRGIVGHTATTGEVVNIPDAYADPRFDQAVDKATGFKTRNVLTVPIYNNRGEVAGVTEMINKIDSDAFDENDIKMMMAFNVYGGISLDNAKLYQASIDLTRQLRGFVEMSSALNTTKTPKDVINEILENALNAINAKKATVYLNNEEGRLTKLLEKGNSSDHGTAQAEQVMKERKPISVALISEKKDDSPVFTEEELPKGLYLAAFPLLSSTGQCLGVMEFESSYRVLPEDMKLLDCFATFTAVTLEKSELQEIANNGHTEAELKKWLTSEERQLKTIPAKLRIPKEEQATIYQVNFDAVTWDGIGHFKVLFNIFDRFDLFNEFDISNEKFFKFLSEISSTYKQVPYHNWRHAVDVTQFVTYQLVLSEFDKVLTKFEIYALLISAICHDANHDGFSNVFNVKAETPLGILFKNQSVMETHHCSISIGILTKEEFNLFSKLDQDQYKKMWNLIIQLILITDMAKHFDFLKMVNAKLDKGELDMSDDENRLIKMQLILKCGDVSNVSRPFELADRWCDVLCEEFFRQGDLEKASGMEYTSDLNDREHLDKPKSQIGFYTFVCLPLYQTNARSLPPLQANVAQVQSNLAVWKAETEAKRKAMPVSDEI